MGTIDTLLSPAPGRLSPYTQNAINRMKDGAPGDTITLEQMTELVGRDCSFTGKGRPNVDSAIRHVEANHNIVWRWDRNVKAWRCLRPGDRVTHVDHENHITRRRMTRNLRIAVGTDRKGLTKDEQTQLNTVTAVAGLIAMASGGQFRKLVNEVAEKTPARLEPPATAKLVALMTEQKNGS